MKNSTTAVAPVATKSTKKVGDMHSNGIWVWTEYQKGKFDWRVANKADQKTVKVASKMSLEDFAKLNLESRLAGFKAVTKGKGHVIVSFTKSGDRDKGLEYLTGLKRTSEVFSFEKVTEVKNRNYNLKVTLK